MEPKLRVVSGTAPSGETRLDEIAREIAETQSGAIRRIGALLSEAQGIYKYRRDEQGFVAWLNRIEMKPGRAYQLISVADMLSQNVSTAVETLPFEVLRSITSDKAKPVRQEVFARAERGEPVTYAVVKQLKEEARQEADDAKLSPRKRQNAKARREAERLEEERRLQREDERHNYRLNVTDQAIRLVVEALSERLPDLQELLKDAYSEDFLMGLRDYEV